MNLVFNMFRHKAILTSESFLEHQPHKSQVCQDYSLLCPLCPELWLIPNGYPMNAVWAISTLLWKEMKRHRENLVKVRDRVLRIIHL